MNIYDVLIALGLILVIVLMFKFDDICEKLFPMDP